MDGGEPRYREVLNVLPIIAWYGPRTAISTARAVMVAVMPAAVTLAFDKATEIADATAGTAALLVNVAGTAGVTAAVERAIVGEAVVGAMDDLQEWKLAAASRDKIAEALLVAVTRSP
jgi:hypothetical protein